MRDSGYVILDTGSIVIISHPEPRIVHPESRIVHLASRILHPESSIAYLASRIQDPAFRIQYRYRVLRAYHYLFNQFIYRYHKNTFCPGINECVDGLPELVFVDDRMEGFPSWLKEIDHRGAF